MSIPLIASIFTEKNIIENLAKKLNINILPFNFREFPDKETYIKFEKDIHNKDIILYDSLNYPNNKILPMLFFAEAAKELGAKKVGLVAPYLAYMRQDKQFNPGEIVTSKHFAKLISNYFDWLITVDPHLHRYKNLNEIYTIPNKVISAKKSISNWIANNIESPILIGPDSESKQWVQAIAKNINVPYFTFEKQRFGDRNIIIKNKENFNNFAIKDEYFYDHTPVLIDDIISTASTMTGAIKYLSNKKHNKNIVCIGVHAIFANNAYEELLSLLNINNIITCNTIIHPSNKINLLEDISKSISQFISI